ncbi:SDR family NAD(P)-dependent oxidoreductase [Rhizobium anhuiense]|uniref:SDR family NAD(P)-dependent oxidoreductase n=1 Tax=Rhizobium anhuiense TaxID=1184720 RepID=UPI0015CEF8CB
MRRRQPSTRGSCGSTGGGSSAIRETGGTAVTACAVVSKEDQVDGMVDDVLNSFGQLDVLVSNAGIERPARIHEMAQWQAVLDVNRTGAYLCAKAASRHFLSKSSSSRDVRSRET